MPWDDILWRMGLVAVLTPLLLQLLRMGSAWLAVHTDAVKIICILTAMVTALLLDWIPDGALQINNLVLLAFAQFGGIKLSYEWIIARISSWTAIRAAQAAAKE